MSEKFIDKIKGSISQRLERRRVSSQRKKLAHQLKKARGLQRHMRVAIDRPMSGEGVANNRVDNPGGYIEGFLGLTHFLAAVRSISENPVVLDLGAGTTKGITEISRSPLGEGISFVATSASFDERVKSDEGIGLDSFKVTSAEELRGIENNSITAVLAMASLAYSDLPSQAIHRIDEVLVEGGLIKATFDHARNNKFGMHTHIAFTKELMQLGYDVAIIRVPSKMDVVLAVKPGKSDSVKATELLDKDFFEFTDTHKNIEIEV